MVRYYFALTTGNENMVTELDFYAIPRMNECSDLLAKSAGFSILHVNCGYRQVEIDKEDRERTVFNFHHELNRFVRMLFI